jgi:Fe/S biogenesis protein NfuA
MSKMTMMGGVEAKIVEMVPEVEKVVDVTDHASGTNPYLT